MELNFGGLKDGGYLICSKMLFVLYDGIGAKKSAHHTTDEFLSIMKRNFVDNNIYAVVHGESHSPETLGTFNLRDWLEWSGAILMQTKLDGGRAGY